MMSARFIQRRIPTTASGFGDKAGAATPTAWRSVLSASTQRLLPARIS